MKYASILILLALAGCQMKLETEQSKRLDYLENRLEFVYVVYIKKQRISSEHCESFSDDTMTTALNAKLLCIPTFKLDQWDIANKEFDARVAAKAQELLAAQAEATSSEEPDE